MLQLLQQLIRKLPMQMLLVALVVMAAAASALYSAIKNRQPSTLSSSQPYTPVSTQPSLAPDDSNAISRPVEQAFEAARKGNLDLYLSQFTDPLFTQLSRDRADKGDTYLRDYLARLTHPLKGLGMDLSQKQDIGPGTVRLPVNFVYSDHNEVQSFVLQRSGDHWQISRMETMRSAPTLIPYGTPIQQVR